MIVATLAACSGGPAAEPTQDPVRAPRTRGGDEFDAWEAIAATEGRVALFIQIAIPTRPEAELSREERLRQRQRIQTAQDALLAQLRGTFDGASLRRFRSMPYLALSVDVGGVAILERLATKPGEHDAIEVERVLEMSNHGYDAARAGPPLERAKTIIGADDDGVIAATGAGQTVVVIDSGVAGSSWDALEGRVTHGGFVTSSSPAECDGVMSTSCFGAPVLGAPLDAVPVEGPSLGHGTQVAVVACSARSIAPDARCFAIRVMGADGTISFPDVIFALETFQLDWVDEVPNAVVCLSLGVTGSAFATPETCLASLQAELFTTICEALRHPDYKVLVVASAGNDASPDHISFPACLPCTVSVAATWNELTGKQATLAGSSNWSASVDLGAPGASVVAELNGQTWGLGAGTSIAAPQVAGAIMLLRERYPDCTIEDWLSALRSSTYRIAGKATPLLRVDEALAYLAKHCKPDTTGTGAPEAPTIH